MCYYSLEVPSRRAAIGDILRTAQVTPHSKGLVARTAAGEIAVCVKADTKVKIFGVPHEDWLRLKTNSKKAIVVETERSNPVAPYGGVIFEGHSHVTPWEAMPLDVYVTIEAMPCHMAGTVETSQMRSVSG